MNKIATNSIVVGMIASQIGTSTTLSKSNNVDTDVLSPDMISNNKEENLEKNDNELIEKDEYLVDEDYIEETEDDSVSVKVMVDKNKKTSIVNEALFEKQELDDENNEPISNMEFDLSIYTENVANELTICINLLKEYEEDENRDTSKLKETIDVFYLIPLVIYEESSYDEVTNWDVFDFIFNYIKHEIYLIEDVNEQSYQLIYLGEKMFLGWRKAKIEGYVYRDKYLKEGLVEYNKDKNANVQSKLEYLDYLSDYLIDNVDNDYLSNEIPVVDIPSNEFLPPVLSPPNIQIENKNPLENNNGTNDNTTSNIESGYITEYKKVGNKCIKIRKTYENGRFVSSTESSIPKSQYPKCGIYTYIHSINYEKNKVEVNRDYLDNDQNTNSNSFIFYTVNKLSKTPYYYNTGIRVSEYNNTATFNQLVDALYQIAIKAEGFTMDDNDKSLVVIEGKPIVIKSDKKTYSKSDVENLLNSFQKVGFKIMESSEEKTYTIKSYLTKGMIDSVNINGQDVKISVPLKLENNKILGPISEIATYLKANVQLDKENLKIKLNGNTITINTNSKNYIFNGKQYTFNNKPIIDNVSIMVELDTILNHLGYSLIWDTDFGKLTISKK